MAAYGTRAAGKRASKRGLVMGELPSVRFGVSPKQIFNVLKSRITSLYGPIFGGAADTPREIFTEGEVSDRTAAPTGGSAGAFPFESAT